MSARASLLLTAALSIAHGCAYSSAMGRGIRSEQSGDLVTALAQYDKALQKKPDEVEAQEARFRTINAIVEQALRDANDALIIGEYELAMEHLAVPPRYDRDRPEVYTLTQRVEEEMAAAYQREWSAADKGKAYETAIRTQKLFPESAHLAGALTDLRSHYAVAAATAAGSHYYPEALATLRTILTYEPDRAEDIAAQEEGIIAAWANHMADNGKVSARARQYGASAAWYARAYEIVPNHDYLELSRAQVSKLASRGSMKASLLVTGDRRRTGMIRENLLAKLQSLPNTEVVSRAADVSVKVSVGLAKCQETHTVTPASKDYVSGKEKQDNPEWHRLTADRAGQLEAADLASTRVAELQADFFAADQAVKRIDAQLRTANAELAVATQALNEAQAQLDAHTAHFYRLQGDITAHQAAGNIAAANQVGAQLNQVNAVIAQWNPEVQRRAQYASSVQQQVQGLGAARAPAVNLAVQTKAALESMIQSQNAATAQADSAARLLADTPQHVWVDVHTLHQYDIFDWTRSCEAPVSVILRPNWEARIPTTANYAPHHDTGDRSNRGFAKAEVLADPKGFPDKDADLFRRGDTATLGEIGSWLGNLADDHFAARRNATTLALIDNPIEGTSELVRLFAGARSRLDEPTLATFRSHVKATFGLEGLELLSPLE